MSEPMGECSAKLYAIGLQALEMKGNSSAANRRKLLRACHDVDRWTALQRENCEVYERTISTSYPSRYWLRMLRIDKELTKLTKKLLISARMYGWTPLGRSVIRRRQVLLAAPEDVDDPMERILSHYERRMKAVINSTDPMEEVLSSYD